MGRLLSIAAGVAVVLLASRSAHAQQAPSDDDRARVHFQAGQQYYTDGRYEEAIPEFREAYRLSHRTEMLLNVANAAEHALRPADAADALDEYLRLVPTAPDHEALQRRLERDRSAASRDQHITVAQPPDHTPTEVPPPDVIPPAHAAGSGGLSGLAVAGLVTVGVGVATGVVSLILGLIAHDQFTSLEATCPMHVCTGDASLGGKGLAVASTVTTFIAAGVGAVGVALLAIGLGQHTEPSAEPGTVALLPGPGDVGLGARVSL